VAPPTQSVRREGSFIDTAPVRHARIVSRQGTGSANGDAKVTRVTARRRRAACALLVA